ncbi:MAG: C4-dicarboxylate ABC transporter permease, partial [Pseudomonadota bacterium]
MNELTLGVGACIFLLFFLLTGIEIAFAIVMVGLVGYASLYGFDAAYSLMVQDFFDVFSAYSLTVIPLFMLMGQIAF